MPILKSNFAVIPDIEKSIVPKHVAIIMDGNNRWAKARQLPGIAGHREGVKAVKRVIECCEKVGIQQLTLFAFSSENWQRPKEEVGALMELFLRALQREVKKLHAHDVRIKFIGNITAFNGTIQKQIEKAELLTAENKKVILVLATSYGGQWDIVQATKLLAAKVARGQLTPEDITPTLFEQHLATGGFPSPDLLIRTSGEQRISNFLLWQCAYTEMYFTDVYWPDFDAEEFKKAICAYASRQRRYGKTDKQVKT